jgi:hypothetical protein
MTRKPSSNNEYAEHKKLFWLESSAISTSFTERKTICASIIFEMKKNRAGGGAIDFNLTS